MKEIIEDVYVLFKMFPIGENKYKEGKYTNQELLKYGIILDKNLEPIWKDCLETYLTITNVNKVNNTFLTLREVLDKSDFERTIYQLIHYITTYGFESINLRSCPFIPNRLYGQIPDGTLDLHFINSINIKTLKEKLLQFLDSDIGISQNDQIHIITCISYLMEKKYIKISELSKPCRNRDLQAKIFKELDLVPEDAEDFIRYVLSILNLPKVNNQTSISSLLNKPEVGELVNKWLNQSEDSVINMAKSWRRNRTFFLAMKKRSNNKRPFNQARRLSDKIYERVYNEHIISLSLNKFQNKISECKFSKLVAYYNYFTFNIFGEYRPVFIRNGKVCFIKNKYYNNKEIVEKSYEFKDVVLSEICKRLEPKFTNRKLVLKDNEVIIIPSTLNQMLGSIPLFSYVKLNPSKFSFFGIHWMNNHTRIDLDLSALDPDLNSISWNTKWKTNDKSLERKIVFSGDMTDAPPPNGAAEVICVGKDWKNEDYVTCRKSCLMLSVNLYSGEIDDKYTYNFFIGQDSIHSDVLSSIRLNDLILSTKISHGPKNNKILGFYINEGERCFVFFNRNVFKSRVMTNSINANGINIIFNTIHVYKNILNMNDVVSKIGLKVYKPDEVEQNDDKYIDLTLSGMSLNTWKELIN